MYALENKGGGPFWDPILFFKASTLPYIVDGLTMYGLLHLHSTSSKEGM